MQLTPLYIYLYGQNAFSAQLMRITEAYDVYTRTYDLCNCIYIYIYIWF